MDDMTPDRRIDSLYAAARRLDVIADIVEATGGNTGALRPAAALLQSVAEDASTDLDAMGTCSWWRTMTAAEALAASVLGEHHESG